MSDHKSTKQWKKKYFNNQVDLVVVHGDNNDNENDSDNDHSMPTTITQDDDDKNNYQRVMLSNSCVCI